MSAFALSTFYVQLKEFADKTKEKADDLVALTVVKMASSIDKRSPVGDATYWQNPAPKGYTGGRFRANWQLGVGSAPESELEAIDPSGAQTQGAILATIPEDAAGKVYYLVNNLPYAQRIEEGWSTKQAPLGVVGLTVVEFSGVVKEANAEVQA